MTTKRAATQATTASPNGTRRAVLYARVSQEEQATEQCVSNPEQLAAMRELCVRSGWSIEGEFADDSDYRATQNPRKGKLVNPSGERADRPQFLAMLDRVKAGEVDVVVCWRDDRLVRHPRVASALEDALDAGDKLRGAQSKIEICDATGAAIDRFVLHIKAVMGREENKRRVERIHLGRVGTLKAGRWPGRYHKFGYSTQKEPDKRGVVIELGDDEEVQAVKNIFAWCDAGLMLKEIRKRLIKHGVQQKGNGQAQRHVWSVSSIDLILRAREYTGEVRWRFDDGTEYTVDIPQIIPLDLWQRVQERISQNRTRSIRNASEVYLLQGILHCGDCQGKMSVAKIRAVYTTHKKDGSYTVRELDEPKHRYRCCIATAYSRVESHPSPYSWRGDRLDWDVWRFIVDHGIKRPELIREQVLARQAKLQAEGENVDGELSRAAQKIAEIDLERAGYQRQNARGKMTDDEFDQRMQETADARQYWQGEQARLRELRDDADKVRAGLDYATDLMRMLQEKLPQIDVTPDELKALPKGRQTAILKTRQTVIRALCDKITIRSDGHVEIEGLLDGSEAGQFELVSDYLHLLKVPLRFEFDLAAELFGAAHTQHAEVMIGG